MMISEAMVCTQGWEALRGDSLSWLLDETRPNLHWRVLVELVGRPLDSPAVQRARGGANVCQPIAGLLADLLPDGAWAEEIPTWSRDDGAGWRLLTAVQWGADPHDPRLSAASQRILERQRGDGGLAAVDGAGAAVLTARAAAAMVGLGWARHGRVQEWLAWLEETPGWERDPAAAVAAIHAARARPSLRDRALNGLESILKTGPHGLEELRHPRLATTDLAEIFAVLAAAKATWNPAWRVGLERLQQLQDDRGRWGVGGSEAARWITLKATGGLLAYAVVARLPRVFPRRPSR